jgi:hypothetical protein
MAKVYSLKLMATYLKVNGPEARLMVTPHTSKNVKMENLVTPIKGIGRMGKNMVQVRKNGQMVLISRVNIEMIKSMDKAFSILLMVHDMMVSLSMGLSKEPVSTLGLMVNRMRVIGRRARWKDLEISSGPMELNTLDNSARINSMEKVSITGMMAKFT